jgi:RNA polymerase sigma-70 factor (ECF subfamily)
VLGILVLGLALEESPNDSKLAARIRDGDSDAFRRFYDRHHAALYRYLRRRGVRTDRAEDLVQKAFLYIWEHRHRIDPEQSLRAYLFRIGYTRMLNQQRKAEQQAPEASPKNPSSETPTPEEDAVHRDLREALEDAIETLPERRRAVFELCFVEDLTYREAADALDIQPSTVETQMQRAFQALRNALEEYRETDS